MKVSLLWINCDFAVSLWIIFVIKYRKDHFSVIVHWRGFDFQVAFGFQNSEFV